MSFLNFIFGPTAEKLEERGDALIEAESWGHAKLSYEKALGKHQKETNAQMDRKEQLEAKILKARNGLAREHYQNAENLIEGGYFDEAGDMLELAAEVNADEPFQGVISQKRQEVGQMQKQAIEQDDGEYLYGLSDDTPEEINYETSDEDFFALCSTLPESVRDAYLGYGEDFKAGYLALNRGEFGVAADLLSRALESNSQPGSYIALELATACINLDRSTEAEALLQTFLNHRPDALPAYQLLCEIYWERQDFEQADGLLSSVPTEMVDSLAVALMKGETLFQAGSYDAARSFYKDFLEQYEWADPVARELAKVCEALDRQDEARGIYQEIMGRCAGCNARIDPDIKHRYAELSYLAGMKGNDILELYLSLAQEMPEQAALYYDRISTLYAAKGNEAEARRYRSFIAKMEK